jgi:pimeloyl-ACP methyl ester carboxylesterase
MEQNISDYFELEDGRIYYEIAGNGELLVLTHAGFVDSRMWDDQWNDFTQNYRVVRFDMRGFGKSNRAEAPINRRDDLYRLLTHLGITRAKLVGCSMGGEIILDFALEHPEMTSALVVVSAVPGGFEMQGKPPENLMEMITAIQQADLVLASELQNRLWIDGPFRQPDQVDPKIRERAAEMNRIALGNGTWMKIDTKPLNPLNPPAISRLDKLQVPTLIIAGQLDNSEILRAADVMANAIPGAQKVIMDDCAHLPNMEKPAEFNRIVLDFFHNLK